MHLKVSDDSYTLLDSVSATVVTGDFVRLTCNGTAISVQHNGATVIDVSDAAISSGSAGMLIDVAE